MPSKIWHKVKINNKLLISLYQNRTDTNYVKGSCTTIILKDLKTIKLFKIKNRATLGIEPVLADNETAVLPLHYIAYEF